jgi:transcriptional regulator with XRE-family HTH domain
MARGPTHPARRVLAANLRRLRLARDLSQDELADSAGVRQALVSAIEVGTANPTLDSLERIAVALGGTVGDLLAGGGKQK